MHPDREPFGELGFPGNHEHEYRPLLGKNVAGDQREPRTNDKEPTIAVTNPVDRDPISDPSGVDQRSTGPSGVQRACVERGPDREHARSVANLTMARNAPSQPARGRGRIADLVGGDATSLS
jgi:hypothetical protein